MLFRVAGENYTVGCILRDQIFKHDITFGACSKYHPQDSHLNVVIESEYEDSAVILEKSIANAIIDLEEIQNHINAYKIHAELLR